MQKFLSGVQRKAKEEEAPLDLLGSLENPTGGRGMDDNTRNEMESKMGVDFSGVKIHRDANAHNLNEQVNAKAFTYGQNIFFRNGNYNPNSKAGKELLAHELVHTVQQSGSVQRKIQRQHDYGPLSHAEGGRDVSNLTETSFRVALNNALSEQFDATFEGGTDLPDERTTADSTEQDTVLAFLLQKSPGTITTATSEIVSIAHQAPNGDQLNLIMKIIYKPAAASGGKPYAAASFIREQNTTQNTGGITTAEKAPLTNSTEPSEKWDVEDESDSATSNKLQNFYLSKIKATPDPLTYDGFVNTGTLEAPDYFYLRLTYHPTSHNPMGKFIHVGTSPRLVLLSDSDMATAAGSGQIWIKNLQETEDPIKHDKIGSVTGMETSSSEEQLVVNRNILNLFKNGERDSEVDLIVPLADNKMVDYTIQFHPAVEQIVNVTVRRIGETSEVAGTTNMFDITKMRDYPAHSAKPNELRDWLHERYPSLTLQQITGAESGEIDDPSVIVTNMRKILKDQSNSAKWFSDNYTVTIFDIKGATDELNKRGVTVDQETNPVKDFNKDNPDELYQLESSFQTMSNETIKLMSGLKFYRQQAKTPGDEETAGLTRPLPTVHTTINTGTSGGSSTITSTTTYDPLIAIYDLSFRDQKIEFTGGTFEGNTMTYTPMQYTMMHETGHATGYLIDPVSGNNKSYFDEFSEFVTVKNITAFTQYSKDKPEEFWAEAFALFHLDAEWMSTNHSELFGWFNSRF